MKRVNSFFTIFLMAIILSSCSFTGSAPTNQGSSDPMATMGSLGQLVRGDVTQSMQQAAERLGLPIQTNSITYLSRDEFSVASGLVNPFDTPLDFLDETNRIVDLGVVYVSVPARVGVPTGFYKVRAYILQSRAELIDASGQPMLAVPLERVGFVTGSNRPMIMTTGCDVSFIYNQIRQPSPHQTVEVSFSLDWCDSLIGR
jgi:hypothetical protein